jgi:hypothetical protein
MSTGNWSPRPDSLSREEGTPFYEYGGKPMVRVEWDETTRIVALLPPDEIRQLMGLGGTADADLTERILQLPRVAMRALRPRGELMGSYGDGLRSIDGIAPEEYEL